MYDKKVKIIVADDNSAMLTIIPNILSVNKNIEIIGTTEDGEEELRLIKELKPDIVITDLLRKNGISGLEVIEQTKRCNQEVTFVILSSTYFELEMRLLEKEKNIFVIRKPIDWDNFNEKIIEIIEETK